MKVPTKRNTVQESLTRKTDFFCTVEETQKNNYIIITIICFDIIII